MASGAEAGIATKPGGGPVGTSVEDAFEGAGGLRIFWRAWLPEGDPIGLVVIAHGISEHSARYAHVAGALIADGYAVYALDHRGHGHSEGRRATIDRVDHAVADIHTLVTLARGRHPGVPTYLLGHSMGGCLSLSYALRHQDSLDGLILSGPVAALDAASPTTRLIARVLSAITPGLGVLPVDPSAVSTDPEVVRDYEQDPLVFHGKLPARSLAELSAAVDGFPAQLPGLRLPLLIMHGSDDQLVPVHASEMVNERAGSDSKRLVIYPGMAHEILNEPDWQLVMADIRDWLAAQAEQN